MNWVHLNDGSGVDPRNDPRFLGAGLFEGCLHVMNYRDDWEGMTRDMMAGGRSSNSQRYTVVVDATMDLTEDEATMLYCGITFGSVEKIVFRNVEQMGSQDEMSKIFTAISDSETIQQIEIDGGRLRNWAGYFNWLATEGMPAPNTIKVENVGMVEEHEAAMLAFALSHSPSIEALLMDDSLLTPAACGELTANGMYRYLTAVCLRGCNLDDNCAGVLASSLTDNIEYFDLSGNRISGAGAVMILKVTHAKKEFEHLNLSYNRSIGYVGLQTIFEELEQHPRESPLHLNVTFCIAHELEWYLAVGNDEQQRHNAARWHIMCLRKNWALDLDCIDGNSFYDYDDDNNQRILYHRVRMREYQERMADVFSSKNPYEQFLILFTMY
jgi:hypothetical protein